jgi:DNA-directed RNA polymerase subunit beta
MGEGGITQRHAVTLETRDVQPTHLGFLDPLATPESGNVGVTVGLASSTEKGETGMTTPVINLKGKASRVTPAEFYISVVGMPDQYEIKGGVAKNKFKRVKAYYKGKPVFVKPSKVQYYMREPQSMFSFKANLVPFLPTVQSNRASMGAKMMTQAVPLDQKEKPLVQVLRSGSTTYEDVIGSYLNPVLPEGKKGTIESITKDYITIKLDSGKKVKTGLYNNFPLNQDGYLQSSPLVKVGDKVNSKTLLAENNYSVGPTLSLGKNLNVAYMSYKGYNFEDAAVMTESAASKLSHTMLHRVNVFFTPKISQFDLKKYRAHFPTDITPENAAKLDERGIIKKGSKVLPDEVVAAFLVEKELDSHDKSLRRLDKVIFKPLKKNLTK